MRRLIVLLGIVQSLYASPTNGIIELSPEHFHPIESLYHSQDNRGHYVYGYATPAITRSETKSADGVTHGGYSYIDADGHLQTVQYAADPVHGFKVAATNLPVEAADVAHARASHLAQFEAIKNERAQIAAQISVPYFNPVAISQVDVPDVPQPVTDLPEVVKARSEHLAALHAAYRKAQEAHLGYNLPQAPQPVQDLPEVVKARAEHLAAVQKERGLHIQLQQELALSPIPDHLEGYTVPIKTHSSTVDDSLPVAPSAQLVYTPQVESFNPYSYGYIGPHSAKSEAQASDGAVRGGYSYIDAFGVVQTVNYIADKAGFRVAASNIPVDKHNVKLPSGVAGATPIATPTARAFSTPDERKVVVTALYES